MVRKVFTVLGMLLFAVPISVVVENSLSIGANTGLLTSRDGVGSTVEQRRVVRANKQDAAMPTRAAARSEIASGKKAVGSETHPAVEKHTRAMATSSAEGPAYQGTLSTPLSSMLLKGLPEPQIEEALQESAPGGLQHESDRPTLLDRRQMEAVLAPGESLDSVGNSPVNPRGRFSFLEIEVSHSQHTFKLLGNMRSGGKEVLYECNVGLGAPEFPTPVGVYYVTHIYDDDPWWIPPRDRAWAAGQSPSRKVYGGIMAPLLKKRPIRSKQKYSDPEDKIEVEVKLDDYGYRFHGTNAPRSIGRNQSHGCVRMLPADVKKVAALIKDNVGYVDRREAENGTFVLLSSPVRLNLVK